MSRSPKNPRHPLVRLRKSLGLTRGVFCERYGIPEPSIRDIENGKYELSPRLAARIAAATGVSAQSLLENHDPLFFPDGTVFVIHTFINDKQISQDQIDTASLLLQTFLESARTGDKNECSVLSLNLFQEWLKETVVQLGIQRQFTKKLWAAVLRCEDPGRSDKAMINRYLPAKKRKAQR